MPFYEKSVSSGFVCYDSVKCILLVGVVSPLWMVVVFCRICGYFVGDISVHRWFLCVPLRRGGFTVHSLWVCQIGVLTRLLRVVFWSGLVPRRLWACHLAFSHKFWREEGGGHTDTPLLIVWDSKQNSGDRRKRQRSAWT